MNKRNQRYVDSLKGKLNELKTVWTDIATTILSGETLKGGLDALINISEVIADLVKWTEKWGGTIPTIFTLINMFKAFGKAMTASVIDQNTQRQTLSYMSTLQRNWQVFRDAQKTGGIASGFQALGASIKDSSLKMRLAAAGAGILQGALIGLAMYGISKLIQYLIDCKNKLRDTHKELQSTLETTQSDTSNLRQNAKSIGKIADEYDTLASKTKLTNEEYERFNELKQEVADLFPELVSGYDENQNPILALTGSLKDYQKQLEETIKEQERLQTSQENALANAGTARANEIKNGWNYSAPNFEKMTSAISGLEYAFGDTTDMKTGLDNWEKLLAERNTTAEQYNKELAEKNKELLEIDQEVQTEVMNKLSDDFYSKNYSKLSDQAKASMQNLVSNFNWVNRLTLDEVGKNKFINAFDDLSEAMKGKGNVLNDWNEKLRQAQSAYQQTGDIDSYKKAIKGVADELSKVTSISSEDWIIGLTPEFEGSLDGDKAAFNEFLKNYGVSLQDYINSESPNYDFTVKLKAQWDADNQLITDLASFNGDKDASIEFLINMREKGGFDKLTPQVQSILSGILDDGKDISDQELQIGLSLVSKVASEGEFDASNSEILQKVLNGQLTDEEIANLKVGLQLNDKTVLSQDMLRQLNEWNKDKGVSWNIKVDPKVTNEEEVKNSIEKQLEGFKSLNDRKEVRQLFIEGKVEGLENMKLFEEIIKILPTKRKYTIDFLTENYGDIAGMSLEEFIDWFNNQSKEFKKSYRIEVDDDGKLSVTKEKIDETKKSVEGLGEAIEETNSKDTTVTVNEGKLQGTVEDYKELIKYSTKLKDGKYKISFVTDTKDAIDQLETLVEAVNNISTAFQDIPDLKITIDIANASKNLDGLRKNVDDYVKKYHKTYTTRFRTETALASKNVTGLKKNVSDYVEKYANKTFKTKFETRTALASKNVTGLKNNIQDYVNKFAGKTYTTTFQVIKQNLGNGGSSGSQGSLSTPTLARDISTNPFETEVGITPTSVSVDNSNLSSMVNTAMPTVSAKANLGIGQIGVSTTIPTKINASVKNLLDSIEYGVELFQELQNRIDKVNNKLTLLDTKMQRAVGTKKIEYLEKQNALYEEQKKLQEELYDNLYKEKEALRNELKDYGFTFDAQGNLNEYDEIMLKMERKADELQKAADKASKTSSDYEGKSDSKKKSLSSASESASNALDKYKEKLDRVKTLTDEYLSLHNEELSSISNEWEDLNNKIAENNDEIEKLVRENKLYIYKNSIVQLENEIDILTDKYDLLDIKMKHALGNEKLSMYNQQIEIMQKQKKAQEELIDNYNKMIEVYKTDLSKYGFKFDNDNNLTNQKEILDSFQNSEDLEKVTELMEEYIDIQREQLPNAISEWENLENTIKDVYEDKLDITKEIEDKITDIYKDQIEKRKDEIQKQCDKEVEAINKVKEAYQKSKEEDAYEKDKAEQQQKIADINKQIERYKKDNSTSAQAKISDLLDQLKTEQENLDKLIEDRRDSLVSDMFDKQIERIQEESDKAQEKLDEEWTQDKISEMVKNALDTGMFTSVTGEITNLESVMLEFAETSGDAIGIMADKVKTELVGNLQAAMDIMKEYPSIMKGLNLRNIDTVSLEISKLGQNTGSKSVNVGDINISVTGNGNPTDIANEVKKQVSKCFDDLVSRV